MHPSPHVVRRGAGTPLLMIHGNGLDHRVMLELDDAFDDAPFERICLDLAGFGRTPPLDAPGGLPELADWLDAVTGDLIGDRPFAIVGQSLGALLARDLVARRMDRCLGMALLVPVVDSVRTSRTVPAHEVLVEDPALIASLDPDDAAPYTELAVVQTRGTWDRFARSILPGLKAANVRAMAMLERAYALPELPDARLEAFDRPVLIVTGRQDSVVGFQDQWALAQRLPRASYAMLDRAGHNLTVEQPDAVRALLRDWAAHLATD